MKASVFLKNSFIAALAGLLLGFATAGASKAAASGTLSFTFDDGWDSTATVAKDVLDAYGYDGTLYMTTGYESQPGFVSWADIDALAASGWEIGCHSHTHAELPEITEAELLSELDSCKADMLAHGYEANSLATPFGAYSHNVVEQIAKLHSTHRGFHDIGYNSFPYTDYLLRVQQVQIGVSPETVQGYIDYAVANDLWLILVFHDIRQTPDAQRYAYEYSADYLDQIAAYASSSGIRVANITETVGDLSSSLVPSNFIGGLNDGWYTDAPTKIYVDDNYLGNSPEPLHAVVLNSSVDSNHHLFSPYFDINAAKTYAVESYVRIETAQTTVGFYIDEYDASNNWISGQYLHEHTDTQIQSVSFMYQPTSANVMSARVQVIMPANTGAQAVIDTFKVYLNELSSPEPEPTYTNLLTNPTFADGFNGWQADSANTILAQNDTIVAHVASYNTHLFASTVAVSQEYNYQVELLLNATSQASVGIYIDEYDANNNWISGQYRGDWVVGSSQQALTTMYRPTSTSVSRAALQVVFIGGNNSVVTLSSAFFGQPGTVSEPEPEPEPTNLLLNGTFQAGLEHWQTDSSQYFLTGTQLAFTTAKDRNTHLRSDLIENTQTQYHVSYSFAAETSAQVALYIDEYDANNNWISGQYAMDRTSLSATGVSAYEPTSEHVASFSVQIIFVAQPTTTVYMQSVSVL